MTIIPAVMTLIQRRRLVRFFEITDYKTDVYPQFTDNYTQDNPIVQIVPRELFTHRGEYFYVGAEYGFYVDTRANTEVGNISTVFVFDIESDMTK